MATARVPPTSMETESYFECECCDRPVVVRKKPGIGYYCDPCVKCFGADPPLTGDEPLPPGVWCYYVDSLAWMQSQVRTTEYWIQRLVEEKAREGEKVDDVKDLKAPVGHCIIKDTPEQREVCGQEVYEHLRVRYTWESGQQFDFEFGMCRGHYDVFQERLESDALAPYSFDLS